MPAFIRHDAPDFDARFTALAEAKRASDAGVDAPVAELIAEVRARGIDAVAALTRQFDRWEATPETLRLGEDAIDAAIAEVPEDARAALSLAAERISAYHARQIPEPADWEDAAGIRLGWRWTPVDAAGLYVPGGLASYPSSLLMNAVPASVAGVGRRIMCVPTPDGVLSPLVMLAARLSGIDEIWRIGGAQAIAAMAYGAGPLAPVDVITGPGNAYVAAAKRQVFGHVGIDMIAGPSEVLVIADRDNNPDLIAIDLLAQAEHDETAQSICITDDAAFGEAVMAAVEARLARLQRRAIASASWAAHGGVIVAQDLDQAAELANRIAPEHLELAVEDPDALAGKIRHAGAIFLGRHTPEALGDYVAGPNHVLPTAGSARFSSGLSVLDFMKRTTLTRASAAGLAAIGPAAARLAEAESLEAHGLSITDRL
ncbi:MAG: histidinol dehydrogenase, partial [Pseudomonadota bacterium]